MSDAQALANTMWAFAMVGHKEEQLLTVLAAAAEWHIRNFRSVGLTNTAWAFAKVGHKEEQLSRSLAAAAEWQVIDFNLQALVNTSRH